MFMWRYEIVMLLWIMFIRIDKFYMDEILIIVLVFWELFFYSLISDLMDNVGFRCFIFSIGI